MISSDIRNPRKSLTGIGIGVKSVNASLRIRKTSGVIKRTLFVMPLKKGLSSTYPSFDSFSYDFRQNN